MKREFASGTIELQQGDITRLEADAIVTAANSGLRGGGGVDGAVHRAAGPRLLAACREIGGCSTGSAVATGSYDLANTGIRHVIHAVGPVWRAGNNDEARLLEGAYATSLGLARQEKCVSIAFPSISTGVYGYPVEQAAPVALNTCKEFLLGSPGSVKRIIFALFDTKTFEAYERAIEKL